MQDIKDIIQNGLIILKDLKRNSFIGYWIHTILYSSCIFFLYPRLALYTSTIKSFLIVFAIILCYEFIRNIHQDAFITTQTQILNDILSKFELLNRNDERQESQKSCNFVSSIDFSQNISQQDAKIDATIQENEHIKKDQSHNATDLNLLKLESFPFD